MKHRISFLKVCIVNFGLFLLIAQSSLAQSYKAGRTVVVNGATGTIASGEYSSQVVIGEPFVLSSKGLNNATSSGLWGLQLNTPSSPNINASEGDFSDKVSISWKLETLSPAPGKGYHVFRDGVLLARLSASDTSYVDTNVKAGVFYFYTITAINEYGESVLGNTTGFVNPNGVITGNISTSKKTPVSDVEVSLSPVVGQSISFDGANDKLQLVEVQTLNEVVDTAFTFSTWVNAASTGTNRMIGGGQFLDGSGASYPFSIQSSGGVFTASIETSSGSGLLTGKTTFSDSQWYQIALTYSTSKGAQLFIDGSLEASVNISGSLNTVSSFIVGEDIDQTTGIDNWDGLIDEIRIWNIARDSVSIQNDKDRTISGSSDNLIGYWRLDEGTGTLAFDLTSNKQKATIEGASFSSSHANLPASAVTDSLGNYQVQGIFYGSGTTFDVTPTKTLHTFTPSLRNATLSASNTGVNNVDFEDDSQISVEGFVKFAGTECFEQEVEILVNGKSTIPKTFTNNKGEYTVEFQPGTSATIGPEKSEHPFSPINYVFENINEPIAGIEFIDNDLVDLTINFAGGFCRYPIGKAAVTVRTEDGCFSKEFETNNSGFAVLRNIPSNKYEVIIKPENPNITFDGVQVDLSAGSDTVEFIYKAPIEAEIELLTNTRHVNGIPILRMAAEGQDTTRFRMILREEYKNSTTGVLNYCYIDSGSVKIDDKIALREKTQNITFKNPDITRKDSMPIYSMIVGRPNFLDSEEHPYQKELQITGKDITGREATGELWAYVEGHETVGNSFITTTPKRPIYILRDPPGDKSYVEFSTEYTANYEIGYSYKTTTSKEFSEVETGGIDETEGEGILIQTIVEEKEGERAKSKNSFKKTGKIGQSFSFETTIQTESSPTGVGAEYDIIIGAAENYLYGIAKTLKVSQEGIPTITEELAIEPHGFDTFYYYTVEHIEKVIIPSIEESDLDDEKKETEIELWEKHLKLNDDLKKAAIFQKNISFSEGAPFEEELEGKAEISVSLEYEWEIEEEVGEILITKLGGEGNKTKITTSYEYGASVESGFSFETDHKTKIVLEDNTSGDAFTVDVKYDPVFGTPVFETKGGRSTNPWEHKTSKRDKTSLTLDSYNQVNVPPTGTAEFTLFIGNENETDEDRLYQVRLIPESNPDGAVIKIGGKSLPATNVFNVPAGEVVEAKLEVERGPEAFSYEDLKLMAYAPGQYSLFQQTENPSFLNAVDTVFFNVHFSEACGSDVAIANFNNFVINQYDTTAFPVQVFGYNPNDPDFDYLLLEYQHAGEDFWIIADSVSTDSIGIQDFYFMSWQYKDLQDEAFNLRVKSVCLDGTVSESNHLNGIIDRSSPGIFGETNPVKNGSLGFNQQISVTFTEQIDTTTLFVDRIRLFNTEEDKEIPMRYSSDGFTVILTPEVQNKFIEGVRIRAEIDTLADINGNWISEPVTWEFEIDRNPIRWNQGSLQEVVYTNQATNFTIPLRNVGLQTKKFTLKDIPDWLSASPPEGDIGANGKIDIQISVKDEINFGTYYDTLNVETEEGDEHLVLDIRALQTPPDWIVNPLDYQFQMSAVGKVILRGAESKDSFDIVAAFVGEEIRGFASPKLIEETGEYLVFMTIYSNIDSGEKVTLRLWDAEDAEEYWKLSQEFTFESNSTRGSLSSPLSFESGGEIAQHVVLNEGWTWLSTHVDGTTQTISINELSSSFPFKEGDRIVSQTGFEAWASSTQKWVPGKLTFNPNKAYQVFLDSLNSFTFVGQEVTTNELQQKIFPGNNWLGYPLRKNIPVNTALGNLNATEGSVIRNQVYFSEYLAGDINRWIGSLDELRAGDGYIYTSASTDTLSFSFQGDTNLKNKTTLVNDSYSGISLPINNGIISVGTIKTNEKDVKVKNEHAVNDLSNEKSVWELEVYKKQFNMPVIIALDEVASDTNWVVGAFIKNELVGIAPISETISGKNLAFLMVYHTISKSDSIEFQLYNSNTGTLLKTTTKAAFNSSLKLGSINAPLLLKPLIEPDLPENYSLSQNYPNPFNPSTNFQFNLPVRSEVSIVIYNVLGQKVATLLNDSFEAGVHTVRWDAGSIGLASGIYFAEMRVKDFRQIRKLTLIK